MSMNTLEISRRTIIAAAAAPVMLSALAAPALASEQNPIPSSQWQKIVGRPTRE
jgi:hypothetical protein